MKILRVGKVLLKYVEKLAFSTPNFVLSCTCGTGNISLEHKISQDTRAIFTRKLYVLKAGMSLCLLI